MTSNTKINVKFKKLRQIAIDEENYEKLKSLGRTGESFNDVLNVLLRNTTSKNTVKGNDTGEKWYAD